MDPSADEPALPELRSPPRLTLRLRLQAEQLQKAGRAGSAGSEAFTPASASQTACETRVPRHRLLRVAEIIFAQLRQVLDDPQEGCDERSDSKDTVANHTPCAASTPRSRSTLASEANDLSEDMIAFIQMEVDCFLTRIMRLSEPARRSPMPSDSPTREPSVRTFHKSDFDSSQSLEDSQPWGPAVQTSTSTLLGCRESALDRDAQIAELSRELKQKQRDLEQLQTQLRAQAAIATELLQWTKRSGVPPDSRPSTNHTPTHPRRNADGKCRSVPASPIARARSSSPLGSPAQRFRVGSPVVIGRSVATFSSPCTTPRLPLAPMLRKETGMCTPVVPQRVFWPGPSPRPTFRATISGLPVSLK